MIPGHEAEQQDSRNNKIYNKYNIAELQVGKGEMIDTAILFKYLH